nr:O-antigen ligase family protein [Hassalia byssoidea]
MVLSTSKTSLVISFVLILIIIFYKNFRWQGKISVIFTNIGILILGCLSVLVLTYWIELLTALGRDPSLTGRTPLWGYVLIRLMERPLLGYGRGAFWAPNSQYAAEIGEAISPGWVPPHAHNGFVDLALDVGLIGFSLFLISYFTVFLRALKQAYATKNPEKLWSLVYLIFLAMNNLTESLLLHGANLYWVLFTTVVFTLNQKSNLHTT